MKTFALSFAINAAMAAGAQAAFQKTNTAIMRLSAQTAKLQDKQRDLAPYFYVSANAAQQYGAKLQEVTAKIVGMNRQLISASWSQAVKSWKGLIGGVANVAIFVAPMRSVVNIAMDFEACCHGEVYRGDLPCNSPKDCIIISSDRGAAP